MQAGDIIDGRAIHAFWPIEGQGELKTERVKFRMFKEMFR